MHHNWFSRLSFVILGGALLYLYQFMLRSQSAIFLESFGIWGSLALFGLILAMVLGLFLVFRGLRRKNFHISAKAELWIALTILAAGFVVRLVYILHMPLEPASDFLRYQTVAQHLADGTLQTAGSSYCDYLALYPGTIGTSVYLSLLYRLFGADNLLAAQTANVILAMTSCFFVWRAARRICGIGAGLAALFLTTFFPSQILFSNGLASEFPFVFLMTLCVWLFTILVDSLKQQRICTSVLLTLCIGVLASINQSVRSTSGILLVAAVICLLSMRPFQFHPNTFKKHLCPILAVVMIVSFILTGSICTSAIAKAIDREPAKGVKKVGWYLFLGMNRESVGKYNLDDVAFWNEVMEGKTPAEAHAVCFDAAIERAFEDVGSLPKLLIGKYEILWGDDGYACDYNMIHKGDQGTLTPATKEFLRVSRIVCSVFYFLMLVLSGVYVVFAWKQRYLDSGYFLVLIWLGTIAAHLVLEVAPRYHYHVLSLMPIIAAIALKHLWNAENSTPVA